MPIVTKILANNPDAIDLVGGIAPWIAGIVDSARELGFTGPVFASCPVGDIHQISGMIKPANNYDFFHTAPDVLSDKMPSIVHDLQKLVEAHDVEFTFDTVMPLSALWPLIQGIEKAQSFDTDKVVDTLMTMEISTPWSEAKAQWMGEEYGYQHLLVLDRVPIVRVAKDGNIEFDFVQR